MHQSYSRGAAFILIAALAPLTAFADHSTDPMMADYSTPSVTTTAKTIAAMEHLSVDADCEIHNNLSLGSRSEEVSCLQARLHEMGLLSVEPTGYFGTRTETALKKWQHNSSVPATGFFGPLSRDIFAIQKGGVPETTEAHAAAPTAHAHMPIDASTWPAIPAISITLHPDALSGYNLEVSLQNFRLAPEHVNQAVVPNEGHMHVYIDGVKLTRLYGTWMHIPATAFKGPGEHEIVVTPNANDHSDLAVNGARIEASATVTVK